jgi:hypothetical protein
MRFHLVLDPAGGINTNFSGGDVYQGSLSENQQWQAFCYCRTTGHFPRKIYIANPIPRRSPG